MRTGLCLCADTEGVAGRLERPLDLARKGHCQSADSSSRDCWTRNDCLIVLPDPASMGLPARPLGRCFHCMTSLAPLHQQGPASARPVARPSSRQHSLAAPFVCHGLSLAAEEARSLPVFHPHRASPRFHSRRRPSPCAVASELRPCQ